LLFAFFYVSHETLIKKEDMTNIDWIIFGGIIFIGIVFPIIYEWIF